MADEWVVPETFPELESKYVHLWRTRVSTSLPRLETCLTVLSPQEKERMNRFYFEKDRNQFAVAHAMLRTILGKYLNQAPETIEFDTWMNGKPCLRDEFDRDDYCFNLSHSDDMILLAVAEGREVGVDVERIRPDFEGQKIAQDLFSSCEISMLQAMSGERQQTAFFECWTGKEAYIKAHGKGLSMPLNEFDVSSVFDEGMCVVFDMSAPVFRWWVRRFEPGEGYAGAFSVSGKSCLYKCFEF
ncbi:MAG: 4'-phosphopantetheinyl transferase superfamily protein [Blastocatellia bacterium]|nr:4'-phosphopantetheinyl transferase superfamily protein [Blastocatellia bacterium]